MNTLSENLERDTGSSLRRAGFVVICAILLAVHGLLVAIGVGGLVEWFVNDPPWPRFSNPELPPWMLLLQWLLMPGAGVVFVVGFSAHWRLLPWAMFAVYTVMGGVCAYQTFSILTNEDRFLDMAIEYAEYTAVLIVLFFLPGMRRWFGLTPRRPAR